MSETPLATAETLEMDVDHGFDAPIGEEPSTQTATATTTAFRRWQLGVALLAALYLTAASTAGLAVAAGTLARGWTPVVVDSAPAVDGLRTGDVVLIGEPVDDQRAVTVAAVRDGGTVEVRRIYAGAADDVFVTIDGRRPDRLEPASADSVVGVGRLVVPVIGLPVVWLNNGQYGLVIGLVAVTISAVGLIGGRLQQRTARRRRLGRSMIGLTAPWTPALRQLCMARLTTIVVVLIDVVLRPSAHFEPALGLPALVPTVLAVLALAVAFGRDRPRPEQGLLRSWRFPALDWVVAMSLIVVIGPGGALWLLPVLPMLGGAVLVGATGAVAAWCTLALAATIARLGAVGSSGADAPHVELADNVIGISVVGLLAGPLVVAIDRVIQHLERQERQLATATNRTALLSELARAGYRMSRLGPLQVETIIDATLALGFDTADLVESTNGAEWHVLASGGDRPLPVPGAPASGLRRNDLAHAGVAVDHLSSDDLDRAALDEAGLGVVLAQQVTKRVGRTVILRAAIAGDTADDGARLASFQMLAGQAAIAFKNCDLLNELQATRDDLQHRASHDPLTGLPNRQLLMASVTAELTGSEVRPALLFCDLDGFKLVNDRLGHETGDAILCMVAKRLRTIAPADAVVSRIGGDEFTILLTGTVDDDEAATLASDVWHRLREPFEVQGNLINVGTSVGLAFGHPGLEPGEFVRRADVAMYEAKAAPVGGPPFLLYQPELDREANRRASLALALGQALRDAETGDSRLRLDYQPVFNLRPPISVVGFEALLRWGHELHGNIDAEEIVEVAETTGQRAALNRFVVAEAARQGAQWARDFPGLPFVVSINASPQEISSGDLTDNMRTALDTTGAPAELFLIEVSQRIRTENPAVVRANVEALVALGVGIVIDDFGRGASSLSFLHEFPLTAIKLDRSLVDRSLSTEADAVLAESLMALARRLGVHVVAEGIETAQHLELMRDLGCGLGQGHFLGHPDDVATATAELAAAANRVQADDGDRRPQ